MIDPQVRLSKTWLRKAGSLCTPAL